MPWIEYRYALNFGGNVIEGKEVANGNSVPEVSW
jgi:hypothetical protein